MKTNFRYTKLQTITKKLYRKFFPVPKSPYTLGEINDICSVHLVPPEKLKKFFKRCIALLQETRREKEIGDYLEFGVFNGSSLSSIYLTAKDEDLSATRFFGFDAFEGLPAASEYEDDGVWKKGFYTCSFENMKECLVKKEVNPEGIIWIKGWYSDTLTKDLAQKHSINNPGIIFIDCDTYSSAKSVLDFVAPLITKSCIICCDDWKLNDLDIKEMGEYKALNEFLEENPHLQAEEIGSYNRKSRSFIIQPALI